MAATLLLDTVAWDLLLDAHGDIALATEPYSLAQDAASAIRTFLGECFWDTTVGVPYMTEVLAMNPPIPLLKQRLVEAALTVPDVAGAQVFLQSVNNRSIAGQVQVTSTAGQTSAASFAAVNPQGA